MSASNAPEGSAPNRRVALANWLIVNVLPGILISFGLLAVLIAGAELYLRTTRPFFASHWPLRFDARYGWTFTPGGTVRLTNHLDFWTETKANSLGFLDREPVAAPNACRVAFIGDSFVEAAQVPIEQKMQVVFEKIATNVATAAFGFSGTGQASQLGFYDVFVRDFQPKVVVLVFFSSDFANNSATLEAIRSGWHPPTHRASPSRAMHVENPSLCRRTPIGSGILRRRHRRMVLPTHTLRCWPGLISMRRCTSAYRGSCRRTGTWTGFYTRSDIPSRSKMPSSSPGLPSISLSSEVVAIISALSFLCPAQRGSFHPDRSPPTSLIPPA